ncbi:MAG: hypothetical protein DWI29_02980 [Planctomycetota bacterium]|nr:MAG: hypothetical protein DWI29_02980 [Planctomycetota bacterium]
MKDDVITRFCDNVHEKLETLQGRLESLKLNIGATYHLLHEKIVDIRKAGEVRHLPTDEGRASLEQWIQETRTEAKNRVERGIRNHEVQYLSERADRAEACVEIAMMLAEASIDDAEWMILEAIAARREAEAVTNDRS